MSDRSSPGVGVIVLLVGSALAGFLLTQMRQDSAGGGSKAAPIDLALLGGGRFDLADEAGKRVVVVNFFATWCGPCRSEMPELVRFAAALPTDRVRFVGIDLDEPEDKVRAFVADHGVRFPVGIDQGRTIALAYGVRGIPTTVVIDGKGNVVWRGSGAIDDAEEELGPAVREAVASVPSRK